MRSDLLALETELAEIETLIKAHQLADALYPAVIALGSSHSSLVTSALEIVGARTTRRKYQYISVIVALYGAMEQFVEAILSSYLRILPQICGRFDSIPEVVRLKNHELTVEYLAAIRANRVHNPEDASVVVRRLARCRARAVRYEFNIRAFTLRNANMSFDRMRAVLSNVGIESSARRLVNTASYKNYYEGITGTALPQMGDAEARASFANVDDLVDRRNRVAHGTNSVDDIEEPALLLERVHHLRMYARAIHELAEDHVVRLSVQLKRGYTLGVPLHRFGANVVCFSLEGGEIAVGDTLFMVPTEPSVPSARGKIGSLEVDRVRYDRVSGAPGVAFGASVPFAASATATFGVLPQNIVALLDA